MTDHVQSRPNREWLRSAGIYLAMGLLLVYILLPILWIFILSVKSPSDIVAVPPKLLFRPTIKNYSELFGYGASLVGGSDFLAYFKNSLIVSGGAVLFSLIIGIFAAYALARFNFKGKENIAFTFLSFRFVPELTIILPLYVIYQKLGLYNTYFGLILVYQLVTLPLLVWLLRSYFEELPINIEHAARTDGYPWFSVFWKITLPLAKPGLAATVILSFILAWNNFIFGLILGSKSTQPVTVGILSFISSQEVQWGQMAAGTVVAILPEIILAFMIQRYLIRGLTFGAVK
ncbi:MAG TPA: carbohydrate ABC transporter permease [Firmicutes bacterium]|nr:carbohydrate ABC transporter permease [Bacillota bacterium]